MSEIVRPHGKITKNPDGSFTITTNSGYQFNIQSLTYSTALGESTLDLLMQIADIIGQMLEQTTINTSTGSISVKKVSKA
ncbi:MAG: hypothetical protein RXR31_02680 [Thermoproteota archaeon]